MMIRRILLPAFIFVAIWSCKKDDSPSVEVVPPRLLSEVSVENDATIREFLENHFYNYEEFANPGPDFDYRIVIDSIAGDNADKTPLSEQVLEKVVKVSSSDLNLPSEEVDVEHTLYYLIAREGIGNQATVKDSVYLNYKGSRLNGTVFDSRFGSPTWFDLPGSISMQSAPSVTGFREGVAQFKAGGEITENGDGTFDVEGSGVGLIIMPSGLAYFQSSSVGEAYAPLLFEINLLVAKTKEDEDDNIVK
ncbi:FKBP-type peptidyl-prolyl cis-trans isomerase [Arenibacter latericius]|uniref:FKBP-type peptidyl-prolyl cis-trans isomerase n=1 Tax=Arenibacter latericius TaxID=86104 RepID=UPI0004050CAD|nr:FKBP-type peptidyl-prolyl cis-trans isomerase [Arenibacter latericius]MDX1364778.1 FKBP-type peptidyl-prolyl cis-trans isomerase [Arenibacter latericius]